MFIFHNIREKGVMPRLLSTTPVGLTESVYKIDGGILEYELTPLEVGGTSTDFENFLTLKLALSQGLEFQLPPTLIIQDPTILAQILAGCDPWTYIHVYTYALGGSVKYRRLPNGNYHAKCEWH
ncbi:hypothetical protein AB7092_18240 [Providencia rettgeri]